jgi:hypothetical protein
VFVIVGVATQQMIAILADSTPAHQAPQSRYAIKDATCYLTTYTVIVYKQHATAVHDLHAHLRNYHNLSGLSGLLIEEPRELLDRFQCSEKDGSLITINPIKMRVHCKKEHKLL